MCVVRVCVCVCVCDLSVSATVNSIMILMYTISQNPFYFYLFERNQIFTSNNLEASSEWRHLHRSKRIDSAVPADRERERERERERVGQELPENAGVFQQ